MQSGWRVGSLLGIPLFIAPSWLVILTITTLIYRSQWQNTGWNSGVIWLAGFSMALLLFVSVLLHELGHSLVARSQGIPVNSITLFMFGGVAAIERESKTPGQAFQVAIAGPAVSFALFILFFLLAQLALPEPVIPILQNLASINLVLALFNMIPGLPLDGGQVLKATIWKATGSRIKGIRWAARTGKLLGWMAIIAGLTFYVLNGFAFGNLWLALLGWFGVRYVNSYSNITELQEILKNLDAGAAMNRQFRVVEADLNLTEFAQRYVDREDETGRPTYYAASDGRYRGLISAEGISDIERSQWDKRTVEDVMQAIADLPAVRESTPLTVVIDRLEDESLRRITVLSPAGAVAGVIDRGDIVRVVGEKMKLPIPPEIIQRIKDEGTYPPGLRIDAIAKGME
jgi:Zn-dependent protease/CBS domain-containing protein